jgi:hypothetical protein
MSVLLFFGQQPTPVGRSLALPYSVAQKATRSAALPYKVGGRAGRSAALPYAVGGRAGRSMRLGYRLAGTTGAAALALTTLEIARLPFPEAQTALLAGKAPSGERYLSSVGWHGTILNPERGSFAVVGESSALASLVGSRVRVSRADLPTTREVYVYVVAAADTDEPISLARRAFLNLGLLSATRASVLLEVLA